MIVTLLSVMMSVAAAGAQAIPVQAQPGPGADQRPHRAALFLSPLGEPFRGQETRGAGLDAWFAQANRDRNGWLSVQEMQDDAARFFVTLDTGQDHEIDPDDIRRYENEIAPEIRMGFAADMGNRPDRVDGFEARGGGGHGGGGGHRGGGSGGRGGGGGGDSGETAHVRSTPAAALEGLQGAGRFGLLNIPEPVMAADADLNRGVSLPEFQKAATARFVLLDTNRDGKLSLAELQARMPATPLFRGGGHRRPRDGGSE
jgi:hypothetical protein